MITGKKKTIFQTKNFIILVLNNHFLILSQKKLSTLDVFYAVHNTNYSKALFPSCNIFFYTQPAFVFHRQKNFNITHTRFVAF